MCQSQAPTAAAIATKASSPSTIPTMPPGLTVARLRPAAGGGGGGGGGRTPAAPCAVFASVVLALEAHAQNSPATGATVNIEHIMLYRPAAELESAMPDTVAVVNAAGGNTAPRSPCSFCRNACTARHVWSSGHEREMLTSWSALCYSSISQQPSKQQCQEGWKNSRLVRCWRCHQGR